MRRLSCTSHIGSTTTGDSDETDRRMRRVALSVCLSVWPGARLGLCLSLSHRLERTAARCSHHTLSGARWGFERCTEAPRRPEQQQQQQQQPQPASRLVGHCQSDKWRRSTQVSTWCSISLLFARHPSLRTRTCQQPPHSRRPLFVRERRSRPIRQRHVRAVPPCPGAAADVPHHPRWICVWSANGKHTAHRTVGKSRERGEGRCADIDNSSSSSSSSNSSHSSSSCAQ